VKTAEQQAEMSGSEKSAGVLGRIYAGFERIPRKTRLVGLCAAVVVVALVLVMVFKPVAIGGTVSAASSTDALSGDETRIPSVIGEQYENAEKIAMDAGLLLVITDKVYNAGIPADKVLTQDPMPGRILQKGGVLRVVISTDIKDIVLGVMPDVVFHTQEIAEGMLKEAGVLYDISYAESDNVQQGNVISQSVSAGEKVEADTIVSIVVSSGSDKQKAAIAKTDAESEDVSPGGSNPGAGNGNDKNPGGGKAGDGSAGNGATDEDINPPSEIEIPPEEDETQDEDNKDDPTDPSVVDPVGGGEQSGGDQDGGDQDGGDKDGGDKEPVAPPIVSPVDPQPNGQPNGGGE